MQCLLDSVIDRLHTDCMLIACSPNNNNVHAIAHIASRRVFESVYVWNNRNRNSEGSCVEAEPPMHVDATRGTRARMHAPSIPTMHGWTEAFVLNGALGHDAAITRQHS